MPNDGVDVSFLSVADSHLSMLHGWLSEPHVRQWWGDPDKELESIRDGCASGEVEGFIFHVDGKPAGYIQSWTPSQYDEPWAKDLPSDTPGVDIFVGPPEMTGKGIAALALKAFAERLFENGAARIVIDPDAGNRRAVRAYAKAGFVPFGEWIDESGRTLLMELTRTEFERNS
ncbi:MULTISPECIES: GNAT family N-acetyltransferase [unclassified Sinorhizobium]|uniref:GNAT family N-acetyltransferase n=1 Tax=unclassified Sinorhizobium TaxID=2613772 RepID=UPI001CD4FE78|nr:MULTISPECIES: GNAT family N-acetyltransferase [unclassified Sinorhizobium]MCA1407143.1 acetyltransferase [Ensifer sp. BRP08]MCA1449169.1 acetyltransferase [Ensifer sp. IC3342]MDK1376066.1 GNAT family N-acetyltransferase [Sinorhizobium sp. 6-70]MDK1477321.1 GNAT family N-acetyltransferase [Sinorhizobium sp. 6-117]